MKVVTWNCQGALHNKFECFSMLNPSLAVIPEMASPDILKSKLNRESVYQTEWVGYSANKGLGILIDPRWDYRITDCFEPGYELFLPIEVISPLRINLLAVWAFNHRAKRNSPAANATNNALKFYAKWLSAAPSMILGDFNNSVIWDKPNGLHNFKDIVDTMKEIGLASLYHLQYEQHWGAEQENTLFMYRKQNSGYHVDYVFVSEGLLPKCSPLFIGSPSDWLHVSDHVPLSVDLNL